MNKSIAQYNGFNSLDSYQNNYSLDYKHKFRNIIANELNRSSEIQKYYDNWGSKCYVFSWELKEKIGYKLHYFIDKKRNMSIAVPDLNWDALKSMNGRYIISSLPIDIKDEKEVRFLKSFETKESFWKIWLYSVI